jgi:hypothetical protein
MDKEYYIVRTRNCKRSWVGRSLWLWLMKPAPLLILVRHTENVWMPTVKSV